MAGSFPSFVAAVLAKKKLPIATTSVDTAAFHGNLRTALQHFEEYMRVLVPHLEQILGRLVHLQHTKYSGMAWSDHWKTVSHEGYDV